MMCSMFFLFTLSNKMINYILPQYHPDRTIDFDDNTKLLFGEIYKMINNSYEMAMQPFFTNEAIDEYNKSQQSQSSAPSDGFSQQFGAGNNEEHFDFNEEHFDFNDYNFSEPQEQYGETPDER